ncbi:PQQ-binding-like beta-propeller repeat protein [Natrialba sp. SSL1]|uniref:outer membrane protein assembly factor BamB family protein n=1 Tax=Natrialba sp. SSL1 TaxID=1869245 RepID=UPI0008F8DDE3|nr:PQQ-binding-like beta-propeller repeat protein [Natrialba sp. SSL1]OIB56471.1 pyrrolo-quinoline quinone [Natrialba sp. SSL1]
MNGPCDRRAFLASAATGSMLGLAGCLSDDAEQVSTDDVTPSVPSADPDADVSWESFQYDAGNTGHAPGVGPTAEVETLWEFPTDNSVYSSPVVVDGTVYVGSMDGSLYALESDTGDERWSFATGESITSSPSVVDGTVYVGSMDGTVYALPADEDGTQPEPTWTFETDEGVAASPTVADGVVYVGSNDGHLYALDADDGELLWAFEAEDSVMRAPAVADGSVYFGSTDHSLYAVDIETAEEQWPGAANGDETDNPIDERWRVETDDRIQSRPTVADGVVYVGSNDDLLYAVEADSGDIRWTFQTGGSVTASPAVTEHAVYAASFDNYVHALSPTAGPEPDDDDETASPETYFWAESGFQGVRSSPVVVGDALYVGNEDGTVRSLSAETGETNWQFTTEGWVAASPAVVDGVVYVGSGDGSVYALAETDSS